MKKYAYEELISGLVTHPYEDHPDYFSKIHFFHISPDRKVVTYYWEAPKGAFSVKFNQFNELIIMEEGVLQMISEATQKVLGKHDCIELSKEDGKVEFLVIEEVKAFGHLYPVDEHEYANIISLMRGADQG